MKKIIVFDSAHTSSIFVEIQTISTFKMIWMHLFVFFTFLGVICSWEIEEKLEITQPYFIYKSSRSRESLFRTTHARAGSSQCLIGASVDEVDGIQKRGQFPCPSKQAVHSVNYSVVFHEEESRDEVSIRPYWTILLDIEVDPMAIGSLTGFLFRYRSLDSMHELFGETGFMYQNLPLSNLDSNVAKRIALKSPYRNKDSFEIRICPLPICAFSFDDSTSDQDCIKLNIQIPDKRNEERMNDAIELPAENYETCEQPSLMTSSVKTVLVSSFYLITIIPESATHDVVIFSDTFGNLITRIHCPVEVTSNPDIGQNIVDLDDAISTGIFKTCHKMFEDQGGKPIWTKLEMRALVSGMIVFFILLIVCIKMWIARNCFVSHSPMKRRGCWIRDYRTSDSKTPIYMHDSTLDASDDNLTSCSTLETTTSITVPTIYDSTKMQEKK